MAKFESKTKSGNGNGEVKEVKAVDAASFDAPSDFTEVTSDRGLWIPEIGDTLQGYPVRLDHIEAERPFDGIVMSLTKACVANDREGNRKTLDIGEEVLIPVTFQLKQSGLAGLAEHPVKTKEVYIQYTEKQDIGGGQTLKKYKVSASKKIVNKSEFSAGSLLVGMDDEPQLGAAPAATALGN